MIHPASWKIRPDPMDMVWHYASGEMPCYLDGEFSEVGWVRYTHRGVQFLDKMNFPKKQLRYIFSPKFQIKYNTAFNDVLEGCADLSRDGRTWITPELAEGYRQLHRLGYAHSFEAWQDGKLVGGALSVQVGGYITCETMFHRVSNASKAAWGQTLVRLKERGFKWIDTNCVASHHVEYGEEWLPQWKFERLLIPTLKENLSLADDIPCPPVPWVVKAGLPIARLLRSVRKRLPWYKEWPQGVQQLPNQPQPNQPQSQPSAAPSEAPEPAREGATAALQ
jgi:leucyl/phenylalanyl-tRNA---protein transferase